MLERRPELNSEKNIFVSISIVDDKKIQELNKRYFNRDYPTDVLSFNIDQKEASGEYFLGDIVVNKDQAVRQAGEYGNSTEEELSELVAHGMLHLMGVHHPEDDENGVHGVTSKH